MATVDSSGFFRDLLRITPKGRPTAEARVVFEAPYAVFVHEDLEAKHPRGGQAKYLEQPMRTMAPELTAVIVDTLKHKRSTAEALKRAAEQLLEWAQELVPVDTGGLRDSGRVEVQRDALPG